jgi:hypothetical protein
LKHEASFEKRLQSFYCLMAAIFVVSNLTCLAKSHPGLAAPSLMGLEPTI